MITFLPSHWNEDDETAGLFVERHNSGGTSSGIHCPSSHGSFKGFLSLLFPSHGNQVIL
jgi:hypothetical protein